MKSHKTFEATSNHFFMFSIFLCSELKTFCSFAKIHFHIFMLLHEFVKFYVHLPRLNKVMKWLNRNTQFWTLFLEASIIFFHSSMQIAEKSILMDSLVLEINIDVYVHIPSLQCCCSIIPYNTIVFKKPLKLQNVIQISLRCKLTTWHIEITMSQALNYIALGITINLQFS